MTRRNRGVSGRRREMSDEAILTVKLTRPISDGGEPVSELRFFRRPTFGDLEAADNAVGDMGRMVALVSRLACLTPKEVRAIDAADVPAVSEAVADLLGGDDEQDAVPRIGE